MLNSSKRQQRASVKSAQQMLRATDEELDATGAECGGAFKDVIDKCAQQFESSGANSQTFAWRVARVDVDKMYRYRRTCVGACRASAHPVSAFLW